MSDPFVRLGQRVGYYIRPSGCWEWSGAKDERGYGVWSRKGYRGCAAHRHVYELLKQTICPGETLDHLCRNPSCVNPAHLEETSSRENTLRGATIAAQNAAKTHCKHGHPLDEANTYHRLDRPAGRGRQCRTCYRLSAERRKLSTATAPT